MKFLSLLPTSSKTSDENGEDTILTPISNTIKVM